MELFVRFISVSAAQDEKRSSHHFGFSSFLSPAVQTAFNLIKTSLYFFNEKEKLKEEFYKLRSNNYGKR